MTPQIEHLPIASVTLNPDNPRLIKGDAFKSLVRSLRECPQLFEARPLLCSDRTGQLVTLGGNMRLRAAQELRYETVPVIVLHGLTVAQEREIAIKDNGSWGEWDWSILANEWSDLPLAEWGVPLPTTWSNSETQIGQDENGRLTETWEVLVTCRSESAQRELLESLIAEGYECKALVA